MRCQAKNRSGARLPIEVGACKEAKTAGCRFAMPETLFTADSPPAAS
jgi:hypothetical protein